MDVFPTNYKLSFEPNFNDFTFKGQEDISLTATKSLKSFSLDCVDIKIASCQLLQNNKELPLSWSLDQKSQKINITLKNKAKIGHLSLKIGFQGILNDKLAGFYRSKYEYLGKEKFIATTQFEAADARRAFPCFDEPSYKATFDITLISDKNLTVVSNTLPKITKSISGGKKSVTFARTPKMSTYLVYLGVGQFEWIQKLHKKVLIRCLTTPGKKAGGKLALEIAAKCLDYYQDYFSVPYPLPKLDLLAIPDFSAGAMENWGAITFRENRLLFYPGKSSLGTMKSVAEVVSHEITHQWFGNLVTMKWWNDLWLNESFATFMAYKFIDKYFPKWDIFTDYLEVRTFGGMGLDSLRASHPINVKVDSVHQLGGIFDAISYSKGGSVLRMLEGFLGEKQFRDGLRAYVSRFKYQNTQASDLWSSLEKVSGKSVTKFMKGFIFQTGLPVVSVARKGESLNLSQKRFLYLSDPKDKTLWNIPLVIQYEKSKTKRALLSERNGSLRLPEKSPFVNVNFDYTGFFVSFYGKEDLEKLGNNLRTVNPRNRLGLIHDLFSLLKANTITYKELKDFVRNFFLKENDPSVLGYLIGLLVYIRLLLGNNDTELVEIIQKLSQKAILKEGLEPKARELPQHASLRATALSALALLEDKATLRFASQKFNQLITKDKPIHPDIRLFVYKAALRADPKNFAKLINLYQKSASQEEKIRLLGAITWAKDKSLIKKALAFSLSPNVRYSHLNVVAGQVMINPSGRELAIKWLITNWKKITKLKESFIPRYVLNAVIPLTPPKTDQVIKKFLKKAMTPELKKTITENLEELRVNFRFARRNSRS